MNNVKKLTCNYRWIICVCGYRYGEGFFVFAAPSVKYYHCFSEITNTVGDIAAIDFYFYVNGAGSWLPIVYTSSFDNGLKMLDKKLNRSISPEWRSRVEIAYDTIGNLTDNSYDLSSKVKE